MSLLVQRKILKKNHFRDLLKVILQEITCSIVLDHLLYYAFEISTIITNQQLYDLVRVDETINIRHATKPI